jgi:hypothetical protein
MLVLAGSAACQPRPRRALDGGDAEAVDDAIVADAGDFADVGAADGAGGAEGGLAPGPQVPPQGRGPLETWIRRGDYRAWSCQLTPHPAPMPSAHQFTRICLNRAWGETAVTSVFPMGAAAVKELYAADLRTIRGYAVMLKVGSGNTAADWYWYQRYEAGTLAPDLPEPIEPDGTVADGVGTTGNAQRLCASCHSTAGELGRSGHHFAFTTRVE